jgi:hypothetical protein
MCASGEVKTEHTTHSFGLRSQFTTPTTYYSYERDSCSRLQHVTSVYDSDSYSRLLQLRITIPITYYTCRRGSCSRCSRTIDQNLTWIDSNSWLSVAKTCSSDLFVDFKTPKPEAGILIQSAIHDPRCGVLTPAVCSKT